MSCRNEAFVPSGIFSLVSHPGLRQLADKTCHNMKEQNEYTILQFCVFVDRCKFFPRTALIAYRAENL